MKKIMAILLVLLLMPTIVFAKEPESMSLEDALKEEEIEYDLGDYQESDQKVNVYLFRGKGCSHCYEFLEYVSKDLIKESGEYFNLVTYEVWNNEDNKELMDKVAEYLGEEAGGVPFIVIGDKVFAGYAESMNDEMKEAIKKLYDSEDRYDVIKKLETDPSVKDKKKSKNDSTMTVVFILFASVALVVLIVKIIKK
ncbi:MAG: hypothetical protein IKF01_04735 [Bacilli bacterium]|nr:hypothetical protein [Bacilli bacterium]